MSVKGHGSVAPLLQRSIMKSVFGHALRDGIIAKVIARV
ncbi:hypothetical protein PLANPX_3951 [Lacipirellula parvula]|uniref:Uncharacterized protein n=1 Tax=Lacipirellula parvula TaxID=2650471 RepID=A0A5K7XMN4_9BACT|nr:hypothetical protein PLANPX_3951 [Lacipirellula parvula]